MTISLRHLSYKLCTERGKKLRDLALKGQNFDSRKLAEFIHMRKKLI